MRYRELGDTGVQLSKVGLGCNNFGRRIDLRETRAVLDAAIEVGVTHLDTADIYGDGESERFIGEWLGSHRRDRVVLATKAGMKRAGNVERPGSADHITASIEGSLRRLKTEYIDIFYLHKPDPETPIAETLGALDLALTGGKVRGIACSNFTAEQLREADAVAREQGTARFVAVQNEFSLLKPEEQDTVMPVCRELGLVYIPYYPLASGLLTGKYRSDRAAPAGSRLAEREIDGETFARIESLARFAESQGRTLLELAISAPASIDPVISVIAGASTPEQVVANAEAGSWELTGSELEELRLAAR